MADIRIINATLQIGEKTIFTNLNLHLQTGEWIAILGPSGIGKTSLLRFIAGLTPKDPVRSVSISTDSTLPASNEIAYLAQVDALLPWLTVMENITLQLKLKKHSRVFANNLRARAQDLLHRVGLKSAQNLYPQQLSGGMRQRAALIRVFLEDKPIVLMDEPFSALDAITRYQLQNLASSLLRKKTVLFITHDPIEALRLANKVNIMIGHPAQLHDIATLSSTTPRPLTHPDVVNHQGVLYERLAAGFSHD